MMALVLSVPRTLCYIYYYLVFSHVFFVLSVYHLGVAVLLGVPV